MAAAQVLHRQVAAAQAYRIEAMGVSAASAALPRRLGVGKEEPALSQYSYGVCTY